MIVIYDYIVESKRNNTTIFEFRRPVYDLESGFRSTVPGNRGCSRIGFCLQIEHAPVSPCGKVAIRDGEGL